jgi:hypothetical protein
MMFRDPVPRRVLFLLQSYLFLSCHWVKGKARPKLLFTQNLFIMTFASCICPLPAAITEIGDLTCGENIGQVQKIAFQRRQATPSFPTFSGSAVGSADLLASWTTLLAAADATHVTVTPFFENFVIPGSEGITEGGDDNTTLDGAPIVIGATTPQATGTFRSLTGELLRQLKEYNCENDLTVFLINEFSQIIGVSPNGTTFTGIPIQAFFIGDGDNNGKNTQDKTNFSFSVRYGWRDRLAFCVPTDFDPRTGI